MKCPFCGEDDDRVVDSRSSNEGAVIRRRRECQGCDRRYTTYERVEEIPRLVVKKDRRREPFNRQKILNGLLRACEKRPVPLAELEALIDRVERKVNEQLDTEVEARVVGELVVDELRSLDKVAYVRFASVYQEYDDVSQFLRELTPLIGEAPDNTGAYLALYERELHDRLLNEVLAADPTVPGATLTNVLAQEQAADLLATADDYF